MSIISRITTWTIGQVLKAADLNGEFNNITNLLNNLDAATTSWTNVKANTVNATNTLTIGAGATVSISSIHLGNFTSSATAVAQAVTGVGFKPRLVIFFEFLTGGGVQTFFAIGCMDGNGAQWVLMGNQSTSAAALTTNATACIGIQGNSSASYTSMDSDGFTITWASANAQTIRYIAFQ